MTVAPYSPPLPWTSIPDLSRTLAWLQYQTYILDLHSGEKSQVSCVGVTSILLRDLAPHVAEFRRDGLLVNPIQTMIFRPQRLILMYSQWAVFTHTTYITKYVSFPCQIVLQFSVDANLVSNDSIRFWHKPPIVVRSHRLKAQTHRTSPLRCQSQVLGLQHFRPTDNKTGVPMIPFSVWYFARTAHRTEEYALFIATSLL